MKNIQVIDDASNCTYDIFEISKEDFDLLFPDGQDIEFESDAVRRLGPTKFGEVTSVIWERRLVKKVVRGIHGTLFYGDHCEEKRPFYPTKKEAEMIANP